MGTEVFKSLEQVTLEKLDMTKTKLTDDGDEDLISQPENKTKLQDNMTGIPQEQRAIRDKAFHPTGTFVPFPIEALNQSIPERFEKQVRLFPNRLAVKTRHHLFTYDQLNRKANRLAHALIERRGGGEENIAIMLEHGALQLIAILGVLKAGKTYVPLDPSYPHKRLAYMLADSRAELVISNQANRFLADTLAQNVPVLDIDGLDSRLSTDNLNVFCSPRKQAFITYTSGSTGKPKGFSQTHCNIILDAMNYTNGGHFCVDDRFLLIASLSFVASVRTIYSALLTGASLFPFDLKKEGLTLLADWLMRNEITIYRSVPTVFRHFTASLTGAEAFPKLRLIYLGGEPVYKKDVDLYRKYFSEDCILVNRIGGGEASTFCSYFIDKKTVIKGNYVPVGYVVPYKEVMLLGEVQQGKDDSSIGEIGVRSNFLSPGYWNRPDLDRIAFLPDPGGGNLRVFRTGDLGSILSDGCLIHLGRKDFQVKIRGFRIETAEIELALVKHAAIKEAVVRPWESKPGDQRLVAYLVTAEKQAPTVTELRSFLAKVLPEYMIPSIFMTLDALPLNTSGKIDRLALPAPGRLRPLLDKAYVAPYTPMEKKLAEIWAQVLDLDQVGIIDNFFELGGHSLLATQIISRVVATFRINVSLKSLFQASTVTDMAVVITQKKAEKVASKDFDRILSEVESFSEKEAHRRFADGINQEIKDERY